MLLRYDFANQNEYDTIVTVLSHLSPVAADIKTDMMHAMSQIEQNPRFDTIYNVLVNNYHRLDKFFKALSPCKKLTEQESKKIANDFLPDLNNSQQIEELTKLTPLAYRYKEKGFCLTRLIVYLK